MIPVPPNRLDPMKRLAIMPLLVLVCCHAEIPPDKIVADHRSLCAPAISRWLLSLPLHPTVPSSAIVFKIQLVGYPLLLKDTCSEQSNHS